MYFSTNLSKFSEIKFFASATVRGEVRQLINPASLVYFTISSVTNELYAKINGSLWLLKALYLTLL